ncbi:Cro/C1-type helix-turn-helix DNA-binding protein [Tumebacillus sp. BK434]|uniref:helix-turn-helix domain-containing protein n=1 Tax=Tumebacillus sp. BK434 TaxID=2512169 RepID=UPI0010495DE7|nr:helix-turn-helix transcriptional regulator [Tumebacillus sp. BK434]TCP59018.1 Cro/C1-type helix-turn-helix DNA-binding protein [Tumebacillus sp. BK434]
MSQLLAPTHTYQGEIPLWIRIRELMKEKGSSHSITAMAARIGVSRETLRVMLNGEREIYWFELEKIAQDLKVPIARLLMEDLKEHLSRDMIIKHVANNQMEAAMKMANEWLAVSNGLSEKAQCYSIIAYIHFWSGEYELAKFSYLQMRPIAEEVYAKYQFQELLSGCLINLLNIAVELHQYEQVPELLEATEPFVKTSPVKMGMWHYAKGKWKLSIYERKQAKNSFYQCLAQMKQTDNNLAIGRSLTHLGHVEYVDRNYVEAKVLLLEAIEISGEDPGLRASAIKELAKTLIKLKELQAAEALIRNTLQEEWFGQFPDLKARLLILLSRATGDSRHAKEVATHRGYQMRARFHAYRYLELENLRRSRQSSQAVGKKAKGKLPKRQIPLDQNF